MKLRNIVEAISIKQPQSSTNVSFSPCLIRKTNNAFWYELQLPNHNIINIVVECRFRGIPHMRQSTLCITYNDTIVYHATTTTPKELYKEAKGFIKQLTESCNNATTSTDVYISKVVSPTAIPIQQFNIAPSV